MSIIIGADLVPTMSNIELFNKGNVEQLVGKELFDILKKADFRVFNLEVPLTDVNSPIDKCGPSLIAPTSTISGYKALNVDLLTIANNHIMDQGEQGFFSSLKLLNENGIPFIGGGENLTEASKGFVKEINGKKIGFYACAEHEFSIATNKKCGANPFDPLESFDHVVELKKQSDFLIVLYHGGKEHYRYPSPKLQKVCRKFIDKGANIILCQHSHCVGCKEEYNDGTIIYGQGNFLFDHRDNEFWGTSLLIKINYDFSIDYLSLEKRQEKVRLARGDKAKEIIDGFNSRSEEIKKDGFIEKNYKEYANSMIKDYLFNLCGIKRTFVFKMINKISGQRYSNWVIKRKYNKKHRLAVINYLQCEAHNELLSEGLDGE